jgi:hypothetical protein
MCGSGAIAGVLAREWRTVASDAQTFCRILAAVQGGGFSEKAAMSIVDRVVGTAREHAALLGSVVRTSVDREEEFLHGDVSDSTLEAYRAFVRQSQTYPKVWSDEISARRSRPDLTPFMLCTAYFSNVYFGVRQCVEIDSLRFAIEQLASKRERTLALGALVATMSALGSTYAGHFAQPPLANTRALSVKTLPKIWDRRSQSVFHEFSVRIVNLARESQTCRHSVALVDGPWERALELVAAKYGRESVTVYLDAPYKREEYSRYYHVLETIVLYNYPSSTGSGRVPSKAQGERFASKFATRSRSKVEGEFVNVICNVLARGWNCAWSYASSGDARLSQVIEGIGQKLPVTVESVAVGYIHKGQGGRRAKPVHEYLFMFRPGNRRLK